MVDSGLHEGSSEVSVKIEKREGRMHSGSYECITQGEEEENLL